MEQNFGPHIEQKCATLLASLGKVSSWNSPAVFGSSDRLNWSCQSLAHVNVGARVGARAEGVIQRGGFAVAQADFTHRHANIGMRLAK